MIAAGTSQTLRQGGSFRSIRTGSKLLFGRMFEDWTIESTLFSPGGRVFCIASAGCSTLELAGRGHPVDAVDLNPVQVRYVRERVSGAVCREGIVDHHLRKARRFLSWFGPCKEELETFLCLQDPKEQIHFWETRLIHGIPAKLVELALHRWMLRFFYQEKFLKDLPVNFGQIIRKRFERSFSLHPNQSNHFVWRLLMGSDSPEKTKNAPITIVPNVHCDDAAHFLESGPPARYDGFSLSNILDGAEADYAKRLWHAVERASRPGAVIVLRSFQEPENEKESFWASQDRAMLWGRIVVCKKESILE